MLTSLSSNVTRKIGINIGRQRSKLAGDNNNTIVLKKNYKNSKKGSSMDGNSIVTQVSKEDESLNISNGYTNKSQEIISKKKENKRRSFLHTLRCCFGNPRHTPRPEKERPQLNNSETKDNTKKPPSPAESPNATPNGERKFLLPKLNGNGVKKKCAIIDLDETLVHSSFKPISNADFIVPVEIDGTVHQVYVLKRPHVDNFLKRMGEIFECVLFTASLSKYADPVADLLDMHKTFSCRLFRDSCVFHKGNYVKDLSLLGRDLNQIIIIDNSPASYIFHPDNAVPVLSWFDDDSDIELMNLIPYLEAIAESDDVYSVLSKSGFTTQAAQAMQQLQQQIPSSVAYKPVIMQAPPQQSSSDEDDDNSSTNSHSDQDVQR